MAYPNKKKLAWEANRQSIFDYVDFYPYCYIGSSRVVLSSALSHCRLTLDAVISLWILVLSKSIIITWLFLILQYRANNNIYIFYVLGCDDERPSSSLSNRSSSASRIPRLTRSTSLRGPRQTGVDTRHKVLAPASSAHSTQAYAATNAITDTFDGSDGGDCILERPAALFRWDMVYVLILP